MADSSIWNPFDRKAISNIAGLLVFPFIWIYHDVIFNEQNGLQGNMVYLAIVGCLWNPILLVPLLAYYTTFFSDVFMTIINMADLLNVVAWIATICYMIYIENDRETVPFDTKCNRLGKVIKLWIALGVLGLFSIWKHYDVIFDEETGLKQDGAVVFIIILCLKNPIIAAIFLAFTTTVFDETLETILSLVEYQYLHVVVSAVLICYLVLVCIRHGITPLPLPLEASNYCDGSTGKSNDTPQANEGTTPEHSAASENNGQTEDEVKQFSKMVESVVVLTKCQVLTQVQTELKRVISFFIIADITRRDMIYFLVLKEYAGFGMVYFWLAIVTRAMIFASCDFLTIPSMLFGLVLSAVWKLIDIPDLFDNGIYWSYHIALFALFNYYEQIHDKCSTETGKATIFLNSLQERELHQDKIDKSAKVDENAEIAKNVDGAQITENVTDARNAEMDEQIRQEDHAVSQKLINIHRDFFNRIMNPQQSTSLMALRRVAMHLELGDYRDQSNMTDLMRECSDFLWANIRSRNGGEGEPYQNWEQSLEGQRQRLSVTVQRFMNGRHDVALAG